MINKDYAQLILKALDHRALLYQGVRKIISPLSWEFDQLPSLTYEELGYGKNKQRQLERNYISSEEFYRVRQILSHRDGQTLTSVAVSLRGAKKESRSQGWCMLSLVLIRTKRQTIVEVQYRSTELVLKFGGDLVFLPWMLEKLDVKPDEYRFHFATCYLSGVYFPYVCNLWGDPVKFLQEVDERDEQLFQNGTRFFLRSSYRQDQVFPYSPENVAHKFAWSRLGKKKMSEVREYLESRHKTFGKPLPKTHYIEGEYIPRGKRK